MQNEGVQVRGPYLEMLAQRAGVRVRLVADFAEVRLVRRVHVHVLLTVAAVGEASVAAGEFALERFLTCTRKHSDVTSGACDRRPRNTCVLNATMMQIAAAEPITGTFIKSTQREAHPVHQTYGRTRREYGAVQSPASVQHGARAVLVRSADTSPRARVVIVLVTITGFRRHA